MLNALFYVEIYNNSFGDRTLPGPVREIILSPNLCLIKGTRRKEGRLKRKEWKGKKKGERERRYKDEPLYTGAVLCWGGGHVPPQIHLLPLPQIQKLANRSDVIYEVTAVHTWLKIQIFRGSVPDPAGGAYSAPPVPVAAPSQ